MFLYKVTNDQVSIIKLGVLQGINAISLPILSLGLLGLFYSLILRENVEKRLIFNMVNVGLLFSVPFVFSIITILYNYKIGFVTTIYGFTSLLILCRISIYLISKDTINLAIYVKRYVVWRSIGLVLTSIAVLSLNFEPLKVLPILAVTNLLVFVSTSSSKRLISFRGDIKTSLFESFVLLRSQIKFGLQYLVHSAAQMAIIWIGRASLDSTIESGADYNLNLLVVSVYLLLCNTLFGASFPEASTYYENDNTLYRKLIFRVTLKSFAVIFAFFIFHITLLFFTHQDSVLILSIALMYVFGFVWVLYTTMNHQLIINKEISKIAVVSAVALGSIIFYITMNESYSIISASVTSIIGISVSFIGSFFAVYLFRASR